MKKYIALFLVLVCILPGCSNKSAEPTDTSVPTETTAPAPTPIGTLYAAFGAELELTYDENGNALTITGINETGKQLAEAKQDQLNKGCVYALRSILRYAITSGLMEGVKTVTVRVGAKDSLPSEDFLATIGQDCQYLVDEEVSGIDMYCLTEDLLDEEGNLTFETAKMLAGTYLGAEAIPAEVTEVGVFTFTAGDRTCTVDAFTGLVTGISVEN